MMMLGPTKVVKELKEGDHGDPDLLDHHHDHQHDHDHHHHHDHHHDQQNEDPINGTNQGGEGVEGGRPW